LGWNATSAGWLRLGARVSAAPASPDALVPSAGSGASSTEGVEAVPIEVALAFHPRTLGQLLFVRSALRLDDRTDRFLAAALTGILHGKSASYLSELMPNTFSMAPRYVRDFAARTAFASPERDVFDGLSKKLDRLFRQTPPSIEGIALLGDARDVAPRARAALRGLGRADRARLVVTSPPYLRVVKYGYYNWLRTWFLGFDARAIDATLDDAHHREPYLEFLREVLAGLRPVLADDAVVVLVIGDVETDRGRNIRGGVDLAARVWEMSAEPEGYRLAGVTLDDVAANRKMTKLWGHEAGRATKTDRILMLGATEAGRRRALAGAPLDVDWTWPPRALRPL
jgi:site-specific DNA-methyltransferase (adenine-specific)